MAASSVSLKEYLKRYESGGGADEPNKKKKRKTKKAKPDAMPGVIVVDEDPVWQKPVPVEEEEEDSPGEEQPIVDEDIEVKRMKRLEAIRSKKPYHAISEDGSGWIAITNLSKQSEESADRGNGNDLSLPRQYRAQFDTPSPGCEQRLSAKPDLSPPRQARKSPAGDISSARRARKGSPEDLSPPRKVRQSSEDIPDPREDMVSADLSPPRRRRRHSSDDISPPHMAHNRFKDSAKLQEAAELADLSPPKRRRRDSPDDLSSPRRRQRDSPNNLSPPRRKRRDTQDDLSLPRWAHHSSLDGNRPRGSPTADLSPPRRNQQHSSETVKPCESNVDDLSPPRITRKESHTDDLSPPRKARKELLSSTAARRSGLFSAQEIKEELDMKRKEEISRFAAMDPSISGRGAEPVFRDKEGRRISKEEMLKSQEEEKPKEKKLEWGKGLAQKREAEARALELEHEKERPFARNRDDPELDKMLKEKIRWGDPMAHLVKRKHSEPVLEDLGDDEKMKESGFIIPQTIPSHSWIKRGLDFPPNRYSIRPGRHWDGVDRSNGYEKELFKRQNEKRATEVEAYLWSVSDM